MEINWNKYRIKEETYQDGHKKYIAQYSINLFFFKIWRNYICDRNESWTRINLKCTANTYKQCKERLINSLKYKQEKIQKKRNRTTKKKTKYLKVINYD